MISPADLGTPFITSWARARRVGGVVRPRARAVLTWTVFISAAGRASDQLLRSAVLG